MQLKPTTYNLFAKSIGALLSLMGLALITTFTVYLVTGSTPLQDSPVSLSEGGMLIFASIGAFALPLGVSLFGADGSTPTKLRIAAMALGVMAVLRLAAFIDGDMREALGVAPLAEFFILEALATLAYFARPSGVSPIETQLEFEVDAPASKAWELLGERFADVGTFLTAIQASTLEGELGVGAVRTCEIGGFGPFPSGQIKEELVEFNRETMRFTYVAKAGLPPMFTQAKNRWSVYAVGDNRARIRSHASVDLKWWAMPLAPLLGFSIQSNVGRVADEIEHRVTTGQPHPRKTRALGLPLLQ